MTHRCVSKLTIIGSDNGLSPGRRQAIIWTNVGILLIRTFGTNFSEILSEIHAFSLKKIHLKMSSAKWRQFCLGFNVWTPLLLKLVYLSSQIGRRHVGLLSRSWPMRPVTRSFDVYFDLRPNKRLSKQSLGWWFETLSPHYDVIVMCNVTFDRIMFN